MKKQMKLSTFCAEYDVARSTAILWIHSKGFPSYKIDGRWCVDIEEYKKWRETQHMQSYKYAQSNCQEKGDEKNG